MELNAEIRKYQGVSKSADKIGTEYSNFFKDDIFEMLWGVQNKIQAREQLCIIFQVINNVIQQESSEGENFHKFRGFVAIHKNLLCEIGRCRVFGGDNSK